MRSKYIVLTLSFTLIILASFACSRNELPKLADSVRETGKLELMETEVEQTFYIRGKEWRDIRTLEEGLTSLADLLKIGDRVGVYSFRSYAVAYLDLSNLQVEDLHLVKGTNKVDLTLPVVTVEATGRSTTLKALHERVSGSKSPITSEEKRKLQNRASKEFLERLKPGMPLYEEMSKRAEARATAFFKGLLETSGYELREVSFDKDNSVK